MSIDRKGRRRRAAETTGGPGAGGSEETVAGPDGMAPERNGAAPAELGGPVGDDGGPAADAGEPVESDAEPIGDGAELDGERGRPWYRRTSVLVAVAAFAGLLGQFWAGFLVILALVTDRTRANDVRAAGSVLTLWWLVTWTLPGGSPYPAFGLLVASAGLFARAALRHRREGRRQAALAGFAVAAGTFALAVMALVPYGVRSPDLTRQAALSRALEARRGEPENIDASDALVLLARTRFTKRPYYFVVLHEPNPERARTGDGEPCFRRAETHVVDALNGDVRRGVVVDALEEDGFCLPVPAGTRADLLPVPR